MTLRVSGYSELPVRHMSPDGKEATQYQKYKFGGSPEDKVARKWFWPSNRVDGAYTTNKLADVGGYRLNCHVNQRASSAPKSTQSQRSGDDSVSASSVSRTKDLAIPNFLTRDMERTRKKVERDQKKEKELERIKVLERHRIYSENISRKKLSREQLERRSGSPYQHHLDASKDISLDVSRPDISHISRRSPILPNATGKCVHKGFQHKVDEEDEELEKVEDIVLETEYEIDKFMSTMKPAKFLYMGTDLWM